MKKIPGSRTLRRRRNAMGYMFMLPWILGFMLFTAFPFIYTFVLSFHDVTRTVEGWQTAFTGINNYTMAFLRNPNFTSELWDFMLMVLTYTPTILVISLILALLLGQSIRFRAGYRMLFFLPVIVMSGPVMKQLTESGGTRTEGLSDMLLFQMVNSYSPALSRVLTVLFENYSMVLWFTGIPIVLFLSGLQKINPSVLEAATIDAATPWQILWKIKLPMLRSIILVGAIFTIVSLGLNSENALFIRIRDTIYATTSGLGLASAYAWVYSLVILVFIGACFLLLREPKDKVVKVQKVLEKSWRQSSGRRRPVPVRAEQASGREGEPK